MNQAEEGAAFHVELEFDGDVENRDLLVHVPGGGENLRAVRAARRQRPGDGVGG